MPVARTRASVSAMPKMTTLWPRCSRRRARAVIGLMWPVPGKQNAPSLAMVTPLAVNLGPKGSTEEVEVWISVLRMNVCQRRMAWQCRGSLILGWDELFGVYAAAVDFSRERRQP
jgi:hypothetical protein